MPRPRPSLRVALRHGALVAALTSLPFAARAQGTPAQNGTDVAALPNPRHVFEDSWFWGVKGGVARFGTLVDGRVSAPLAGAEWLVTHRRAALLVSAEQSFFNRSSAVLDPYGADGVRTVSIHDARRYSAAVLAAPVAFGHVRPYAGLGLALMEIRRATPQGDFSTQEQLNYVQDAVNDGQSIVAPFLTAGAHVQFGAAAVFLQGHLSAAQTRSLWNRGGWSQLEAGVRYNVASAFEK